MTASFSLFGMSAQEIANYFHISVEAAQAKLDAGAITADDIWYGVRKKQSVTSPTAGPNFNEYVPKPEKPKTKNKSPFGKRYF